MNVEYLTGSILAKAQSAESESKFTELFPFGRMSETTLDGIPEEVIDRIGRAACDGLKGATCEKIDDIGFLRVDHLDGSGDTTFVGFFKRLLVDDPFSGKIDQVVTILVDLREDSVAGYARILLDLLGDPSEMTPYISFMRTNESRRRNGIGTRRIKLMNAISRTFFELPLYSGNAFTEEGERLFTRLHESGETEKLSGYPHRFVFNK